MFAEPAQEATRSKPHLRQCARNRRLVIEAADAGPKMAALLAAAGEPMPDVPLSRLTSEGVILIYGCDEQAIEAANLLKDHLDVTVMISRPRLSRRAASTNSRW